MCGERRPGFGRSTALAPLACLGAGVKPSFCTQKWCYVDPCDLDAAFCRWKCFSPFSSVESKSSESSESSEVESQHHPRQVWCQSTAKGGELLQCYHDAWLLLDVHTDLKRWEEIPLRFSEWFRRGKTLYYSYEACGFNDTFTLSYNKILGGRWLNDSK